MNERLAGEQPILLGREKAAALLGVSVRMIGYLVARGELRAVRVGKRQLFRRATLEAFARRDHPGREKEESTATAARR